MNKTNIEHALYGLLMQGVSFAVVFPFAIHFKFNPVIGLWVGTAFACAWFISREHMQQQHFIAQHTGVSITNQNPFKAFCGWSLDSILDAVLPVLLTVNVAVFSTLFTYWGQRV